MICKGMDEQVSTYYSMTDHVRKLMIIREKHVGILNLENFLSNDYFWKKYVK